MLCYRDRTFCGSDCVNDSCMYNFSPQEQQKAIKWWGGEDVPVAFSDMTRDCKFYKGPNE